MSLKCGQSCILCNILDYGKSRCGTTQECETLMGLGCISDDILNSTSFDKWFIWLLKTFDICNCLFSPLSISLFAVSWLTKVESDPLSNKAFVLTLKLSFDKITGISFMMTVN